VPLPKSAYDLAWTHFNDRKLGTVFAGKPMVGVTIDKLLAMEAKL
jgi:phosphate transport system substrate-binding protein